MLDVKILRKKINKYSFKRKKQLQSFHLKERKED